MAKKESTFLNMTLTLFLVTLIAGTSLGFVYEFTKTPIATVKLKQKLAAIQAVVPNFENNPNQEMYSFKTDDDIVMEFYPAKDASGNLVGTAIKTYTNKGFSGIIWLMVGLKPDGTIIDISVLEHKETPGLGTKMDEPTFKNQFHEKNPANFQLKVKKDGGQVDAITAATISSRAFCDAVQRAYDVFKNYDANTGATN